MKALDLKMTAVAAALTVSGSASAAIDGFAGGNGELFLNISTTTNSFTADLTAPTILTGTLAAANAGNPTMGSFTAGPLSAPGLTLRWDLNGYSYQPPAGGTVNPWTQFLATGATADNSIYNVAAGDSQGSVNTPGALNYLSTSSSPLAAIQAQTNAQLVNFRSVNLAGGLIPGVNGLPSHNLVDDGASVASAADVGAFFPVGMSTDWKGSAAFNSTDSVMKSLPFYLLSNAGTGNTPASVTPYGGTFSVDMQNGFLYYQTPAAVPEPGTWVLLVAGLVSVGAISRRRLRA
jgi:hypothetical protein